MTGLPALLRDLLRELTPPTPGECHVWRLPVIPGRWDSFDLLDEGERRRRSRFLQAADRDRYQTAHVGVRLLLGGYLGLPPERLRFSNRCRHCAGDHGKPALLDPPTKLDFSLSHSGGQVAIAVAAEPVGVDVQEIDAGTDLEALSSIALAPEERSWLAGQPEGAVRRAFFGYWARKEALLKATGHGLAVPMARITLSPPDEPAELVRWAADQPLDEPARLHDLEWGADYTGSVAVLSALPIRVVQADLPAPGDVVPVPPDPAP